MTLSERVAEFVRAAFSGLWIQSHEHDDAVAELGRLCQGKAWGFATWDIDKGLQVSGGAALPEAGDPLAAIRAVRTLATSDGAGILVLRNFHRFLGSVEIVQALLSVLYEAKQSRAVIVILAPVVQIPIELEKQFVVLTHDLPDLAQIEAIARGVAVEPGELPGDPEGLARVVEAAAGLTRAEAENAFSLSLVRHGRLDPEVLWDLKTQTLKKSGLLEMYRGGERFADLGGLENLKAFCLRANRGRSRHALPRGVLILGVPGTGKSMFAKALGNELGLPTVILDLGRLKGGLVGETEQRTREALRLLRATRRNVAFIDEVEKALAGASQQGVTDSGVALGQFGTLLSHMADHPGDSFFVLTANDISKLPPEFTRAGRLNAVFFVDLPDRAQKDRIWTIHLDHFGLDASQRRPADAEWTGSEIRTCCETADLLEIPLLEAAQYIVPVAVTAGETIESLRQWASGRCLSAERPGLYVRETFTATISKRPPRSLLREPPLDN